MKTKYIFLVTWMIWTITGCTDFLDESNRSNFTRDNYFKTAEHAESIVNSLYESLRLSAGSDYGGNPYFMTDFQTGLAGTRVGQNTNINNIRLVVNNSDNRYSRSWWESSYKGIANANLAIERIPDIQMDNTKKTQLLGQAHFMRAYFYFNLVRMFGNIPLILVPIDASSPELFPFQASAEDVYQQILEDLDIADKAGLSWLDTSGRVSRGAVKYLQASVCLTMAGYPLQKGDSYYRQAAAYAKELMDSGQYNLFTTYDDLHNPDTDNRGEHIFMIQYLSRSSSVENPYQILYLPYNLDISMYSTETGSIYPLNEFLEAHESGDKRLEEKQFYYSNYTSNANREELVEFGTWYIYKFFDTDAHLNTASSGLNYPLIRYTDLLLIYAEAQNEADGAPSVLAYDCLNRIRSRAELPALSGLTQDQFRKAVWRERYFELSFENKIWFDMARTRKALNLQTGDFNDYVGHTFVYGPQLSARELLFPIPTQEMNTNKNLEQNPGY